MPEAPQHADGLSTAGRVALLIACQNHPADARPTIAEAVRAVLLDDAPLSETARGVGLHHHAMRRLVERARATLAALTECGVHASELVECRNS